MTRGFNDQGGYYDPSSGEAITAETRAAGDPSGATVQRYAESPLPERAETVDPPLTTVRNGATPAPSLASLLDELAAFVRRYVVMGSHEVDAVALWIAHTYVIDAAESTPYLDITGPERRVGKSRLLEVLALLCRKPIETANISEAALFRIVGSDVPPTLLFDEIDAIFGGRAKDKEDLRGLLNAGHRRGAVAYRIVGEGSKMEPQPFPVFCPKAFAGIGDRLPDTIADRSIKVRLKRKTRAERVERFRRRDAEQIAGEIKAGLERWAEAEVDSLAEARPRLPDELDDRAQDSWEILLALADRAGEKWKAKARRAAVALSAHAVREDDSYRAFLLAAIKRAFDQPGYDERIPTADLIREVATADESPFSDWWNDKDHKPERAASQKLARLLRAYEIRSQQLRFGESNLRGFERSQFEDVFARYLPGPATPATSRVGSGEQAATGSATAPLRSASVAENVAGDGPPPEPHVADVADSVQGGWNGFTEDEIRAYIARHPEMFPPQTPDDQARDFALTVLAVERRNGHRQEE